ncbi:MAG: hypothetical protein ACWGO1_05880 [Anaerolineales bacterium]
MFWCLVNDQTSIFQRPAGKNSSAGHVGGLYWPGWKSSGAAGMPVIVCSATGDTDVTLIGVDNTFRGHPENTFRLLGNAIYSGQE